ncbi:restriction endonuclease subunit S [Streptococcus koreensis]|uniref:restriction endonuclease subunit S n=1 Tax=Streptococcus koreensis TaxID=2382163 RepID=UPI0022E3894B|nr:restriction endonuclease subunit S [Streptococcus koreensis]
MIQKKVPSVRFIDQSDEWVKTRLNKITEIIGGGTPDTKQTSYWNGGINWFSPTEVGKTVYLTKSEKTISQLGLQKSSAKLLPAFKTILFTSRAGIGDVGILTEESATNQGFQSLVVNEETDVYFLYSYSDQIKKYALKHSAGSTFLEISGKELGKMDLSIPSLSEQQAIGSLFRTLDDLLASYKDNLANYQSLKATMLSKMFPKAGHTVPEIRLEGFEGEWENSKISDYVYLLNGRAFKQDELLNEGKYRVVRVGNFNTNEKWYYSNLELEENKYANKEDLLYLWATNFGPEIWKEEKIIFHYHIWKLEFDRSIIDRNYLYYWLEKDKKRIQQNTNGSTMVHVTKSMMENREFLFPMFREQQAIGTYFSNLDNLIAAHQEKISQLETLKKKLLQDMFI